MGTRGSLAGLIRRLRNSIGLTQEELADRAGISVRTVSDIERGLRRSLYRDTAKRLAEALEVAEEDRAGSAGPEADGEDSFRFALQHLDGAVVPLRNDPSWTDATHRPRA